MRERLTGTQRAALAHIARNGGIRVLSRLGTLSYPKTPYRRDVVDVLLDRGYVRTNPKPRHHEGPKGGIERDLSVTLHGRDYLAMY